MRPPARNQTSRDRQLYSANQRWKSQWNARLALSTLVAVAVHVVIFAAGPSWRASLATSDSERLQAVRLVWTPADGALPGRGAELPLATPVSDEQGPTPVQPGLADGTAVEGGDLEESFESFRARLLSRSLPAPAIAESEPESEPESPTDDPSAADEESLVIGGRASLAELPTSVDSSSLDLDRLSALRPELALSLVSAWVMLQNPTEVEAFMARTYRLGRLDPEVTGRVSVTLWIDRRGSVEWAEITESSGRPDLDELALALFNEVVAFRPARDNGVSVSRSVVFAVNFPW
ncbi:MAG: TonB family protein [Gemmatimonadetes bacterium]|nr:TonB family protein [Gemmatimonadota bacterium]